MKDLEQILLAHASRYPAMELADAVKLVYQNEFGGGHLIRDVDAARARLYREYELVQKDPRMPLCEDIGSGIVRVHLQALKENSLEPLFSAFLSSARQHQGNTESFRRKLRLLQSLARQEIFSFSPEDLDGYLKDYEAAGFPAVSHSEAFRAHYRPAYRIACRALLPDNF